MNTPICDFVTEYIKSAAMRLHMPGHKGQCFLGIEPFDITEIEGADVLYRANGIIADSQNNASALFETAKTLYSTEGSSLCIRAMLRLAISGAKTERPWILAARNVHKAFLSACALLDIDVEWIYPGRFKDILSCTVTARDVEHGIHARATAPVAVYLTSPDYLGNICDVAAVADICHKNDVALLVDNAHGAYLKFLSQDRHPISLGADMCCDSAHKTLPVLTGGAYLHISKNAPAHFFDGAERAMELFSSTSPSYLILQSLDRANEYIDNGYAEKLDSFIGRVEKLKQTLVQNGFDIVGDEPLKLTVAPKRYGYTGEQLADMLLRNNVVCEFADADYCVMMLTPETNGQEINRLEELLLDMEKKRPLTETPPMPEYAHRAMSVREAMLSDSVEVAACEAAGKILASPSVSCPPAVPIVMCGEKIDNAAVNCFEYYRIKRVTVVKE